MDIKTALITLIEDSMIENEQKQKMLSDAEEMTEDQMKELGKALAEQKKQNVEASKKALKEIDTFLKIENEK